FIAQLHTMIHTVPTYRRDSAWSRSCSASETRLGHVPPRGRCCSLNRMSEQRTDRELDSIAQLHTMLHTVPTYRRDSAWSRACSASETRLGHVPPRGRCRCLYMNRRWMSEQRTDRELDSIAQLHTMLHTVPTY